MIRYALACARGHAFEAWFRGAADHDDQAARDLIACPACGSTRVAKAVMAPAVARKDGSARGPTASPAAPSDGGDGPGDGGAGDAPGPVALLGEPERELRAQVRALRERVRATSEDVGRRFADEALAIHRGEAPNRTIRGQASPTEARALMEEGVAFQPLPGLPEEGH